MLKTEGGVAVTRYEQTCSERKSPIMTQIKDDQRKIVITMS